MKKKLLAIIIAITSLIVSSEKINVNAESNMNQEVTNIEKKIKQDNSNIIYYSNKTLYEGYFKTIKEELYKKAHKNSKTVTHRMIDLAFKSADERINMNKVSIKEYFTLVAIHLAVMEVESNFNNDIVCYNTTTKDYGVMQVNSSVIKYAKEGLNDYSLDVFDLHDNVEMGSWEIYECYSKAKRNHPDNVLWWFYAYYNRGLYFENYPWDYDETNTRSKIFINKFNKYFTILYNK